MFDERAKEQRRIQENTETLPKQQQKFVSCCFFKIINLFKISTFQMRALNPKAGGGQETQQ